MAISFSGSSDVLEVNRESEGRFPASATKAVSLSKTVRFKPRLASDAYGEVLLRTQIYYGFDWWQ